MFSRRYNLHHSFAFRVVQYFMAVSVPFLTFGLCLFHSRLFLHHVVSLGSQIDTAFISPFDCFELLQKYS